jgi:uncharacterized phiE125 gp8 family phage protein
MHRRIVSQIHASQSYISLEDVKAHLRVVNTDEDAYIAALLDVAFDAVEQHLTYPVRLTRVQYTAYSWTGSVFIPGRFQALDTIKYYTDPANVLTTMAGTEYATQIRETGFYLEWINDTTLPDTYEDRLDGVQYNLQAGWVPGDLPASIRQAVLLNIGDYYEERKNSIIGTIETNLSRGSEFLLKPYLIPIFV